MMYRLSVLLQYKFLHIVDSNTSSRGRGNDSGYHWSKQVVSNLIEVSLAQNHGAFVSKQFYQCATTRFGVVHQNFAEAETWSGSNREQIRGLVDGKKESTTNVEFFCWRLLKRMLAARRNPISIGVTKIS